MKIKWQLILLAYFSLFFMGLVDNIRGPLYPSILESMGLGSFRGSFFFGLASFAAFLSTLTADYWFPKTGPSMSMRIGWSLVSLSCLLIGSNAFYPLELTLFIGSFFLGWGIGIIGMCMNVLISLGATPHTRRRLFGGLHACYGIASLGAPLLYQVFLVWNLNWAQSFIIVSFLSLPLFLSFRKVKIASQKPTTKKKSLLASPILSLMIGTYVASEIVISSRLVLYLKEVHHFSSIESSSYLSLFFFFLMLGRVSIAAFHFKMDSSSLMKLSLFLSFTLAFLGLTLSPFFLCLCGLSMSIFFPCAMDMIHHYYPARFEQMTASALTGLGFIVTCMHLLFGILSQKLGVELAMASTCVFTFVSFICLQKIVNTQSSNELEK